MTGEGPVTAIVVTWNSEAVVGECLDSIRETTDAAGLTVDIVVVDNGSSDGTLEVVARSDPGARIIANRRNRGLAAANNQGLAASTSPFVLICNPDVRFRPGSIQALLDVLERPRRVGWVVPRLLYEDGRVQTSVGELPTLSEAVLGRQAARRRARRGQAAFWQDGHQPNEETRIGRGHEAAYLVRRTAVDEVGWQDERYVLDWEGFDWADRFARAGWEVWFTPAAEVVHLGGTSIRQVPYRWIASQHRGMYRDFADCRSPAWRPVLAAVFTARAAAKMALVSARVPLYEMAHRRRGSEQEGAPPQ
jgi:N-acetylglucosaminyl-diphospho-decaprenol L-rhamnosyltransferase